MNTRITQMDRAAQGACYKCLHLDNVVSGVSGMGCL